MHSRIGYWLQHNSVKSYTWALSHSGHGLCVYRERIHAGREKEPIILCALGKILVRHLEPIQTPVGTIRPPPFILASFELRSKWTNQSLEVVTTNPTFIFRVYGDPDN